MISRKKIKRIKRKISRQFPEFKDIEPKIIEKQIGPQDVIYKKLSLGIPKEFRKIFKLQYKKIVETVDEVTMERILTVTLNERGEIIKITQSR
jgi:hypothetical protein